MSKIVELGHFAPDVTEVVRQLKRDLKDDFHPDSLGYEDVLTPDIAAELLRDSFERNHGLFVPEGRTELNIPKPGFVLRYSLDMSLLDRLYYQALVGYLVPWPVAGFKDTKLGVSMKLEVRHGATQVYARVQG